LEEGDMSGGGLNRIQKMMIVLRYFGDPGFQTGVGLDMGVKQGTVSNTLHEVIPKIVAKAGD
jgi:hypothetical protein